MNAPFSRQNSTYILFFLVFQVYEKLISGMYLGELTRLVLLDVIEQGILFNGQIMSKKLTEKGAFPTWFVSQVRSLKSYIVLLRKKKMFNCLMYSVFFQTTVCTFVLLPIIHRSTLSLTGCLKFFFSSKTFERVSCCFKGNEEAYSL